MLPDIHKTQNINTMSTMVRDERYKKAHHSSLMCAGTDLLRVDATLLHGAAGQLIHCQHCKSKINHKTRKRDNKMLD
jgi:hypothetical protein